MTKKLFAVELKVHALVWAEDESEAHNIAQDDQRDIVSAAGGLDVSVVGPISEEIEAIRFGWDLMCIPYGDGVEDRRVGELMEATA